MAPATTHQVLLSPAELSYIHKSLSQTPPLRPDGRTSTQFRPLIAETDVLPGTNGSARICFADGTEAIVGVKAEVEKTVRTGMETESSTEEEEGEKYGESAGDNSWVELSVEIPGIRDDDSTVLFLSALLTEALLTEGEFTRRLWINRRFHWKLCVDILLLSQPLSYPLPLLSLTTHLALLSTRLPKLKSEQDEDPLFDDDWHASQFLYQRATKTSTSSQKAQAAARPPITLLVMAVKENIIFDPSTEELAVAEVVLAVSVSERLSASLTMTDKSKSIDKDNTTMDVDSRTRASSTSPTARTLHLLAVRTIDPPSRLTHPGVPDTQNSATGGTAVTSTEEASSLRETQDPHKGVWQPPRGGAKRKLIAAMIQKVLERGGVAEEVLDGLDGVEIG